MVEETITKNYVLDETGENIVLKISAKFTGETITAQSLVQLLVFLSMTLMTTKDYSLHPNKDFKLVKR